MQLLAQLRTTLAGSEALSTSELLALSALIPELQSALRANLSSVADPRAALLLASGTETAAHETVRTQIHCAHLIEATGAHQLDIPELDALRANSCDLAAAPVLRARPSYSPPG